MQVLRDDLERLNWQVWMDHEIHGGEQWWREIIQTILHTRVFLFALSDASWRSRPCQEELDYAKKLGIPVLPVQVGPVHNTRIPIMETQAIDYRERTPEAVLALVAALADLASRQTVLPDPLPDPPKVPFEYLYRMAERLGPKPIPSEDQEMLIAQFRSKLRNEDDDVARADIVKLLKELRRRKELTVGNAEEVDSLLETAELVVEEAEDGATRLPPTDHWRQGRAATKPPRARPNQDAKLSAPPPSLPPPRVRKADPSPAPKPAAQWPSTSTGVPETAKPAPAKQDPAAGPQNEPRNEPPNEPKDAPRPDAAPAWLHTLVTKGVTGQPPQPQSHQHQPQAAPAAPAKAWWEAQEKRQAPPPPSGPKSARRGLAFAGAVLGASGVPFLYFARALGDPVAARVGVVVLLIAVTLGLSLALVSLARKEPHSRTAVAIAGAGLIGTLAFAAFAGVF